MPKLSVRFYGRYSGQMEWDAITAQEGETVAVPVGAAALDVIVIENQYTKEHADLPAKECYIKACVHHSDSHAKENQK